MPKPTVNLNWFNAKSNETLKNEQMKIEKNQPINEKNEQKNNVEKLKLDEIIFDKENKIQNTENEKLSSDFNLDDYIKEKMNNFKNNYENRIQNKINNFQPEIHQPKQIP